MSKILRDGLHQNLKILNCIIVCFIIMILISCFVSPTPFLTFKSLLLPYLFFILASYIIFMIVPRLTFKNLLTHQLEKDGFDTSELDHVYNIDKTVLISKHYIMHIPSQSIINIDQISKIIVKANHQITSLLFVKENNQGRTLVLKTSIIDEILNYLNDPSVRHHEIAFEQYRDENLKEEINIMNIVMILTMIILGILIAIHFR